MLALSGTNSYTGGTTVNNGGCLTFDSGDALPGESGLTINGGGTVDSNGTSEAVAGLSGNGLVTDSLGGGQLSVSVPASSPSTFAGSIQDGSGTGGVSLVVSGSDTSTLSGTNTYTGGTTITAGTLEVTNPKCSIRL